nr:RNA-directed DNA polymerase, eukaryota [Tanacetum cinerariifolium]
VEVEGVPCKWWFRNTFSRIASRWGALLNGEELEEEGYHSNRICIRTKLKTVVFDSFKMVYRGMTCWVRAIEVPGWVPNFEEDGEEGYDVNNGSHEDDMYGDVSENLKDVEGESDREEVPETNFEGVLDKSIFEGNSVLLGRMMFILRIRLEDGVYVGQHVHERVEVSNDTHESTCFGHFKKSEVPRKGGSILKLIDDLVTVGQTMGYDITGCLAQKAKKDWVKKLYVSYKVNFLSLQETKMEKIDLWCIKRCWGNFTFDYVYSESVGKSEGILCVWDPNMFQKINDTISDYFIMVRGLWVSSGKRLLIISVYAPQDLSQKKDVMGLFIVCDWELGR